MRVWHSPWSWLKLMVAAESVAGNTRTGMFTSEILRKPFQVGRAAMGRLSTDRGQGARGRGRGRSGARPGSSPLHSKEITDLHLEHARRVDDAEPGQGVRGGAGGHQLAEGRAGRGGVAVDRLLPA